MKIKLGLETEYEQYKKLNSMDEYSKRVVSYGEDWANLMEVRLEAGEKIEDIAQGTSHEADTDGITGFMYNCALAGLSKFWVHGEELRLWHNITSQLGTEGEAANAKGTVLNSAIINIG